jgi:hypothetical protein
MIKSCPTCGHVNPADAWFCTNRDPPCDAPLAHVDAVPADAPPETRPSGRGPAGEVTVTCPDPDCRQPNPRAAERCQYCGTALTRPPPAAGTAIAIRFPWGAERLEGTLRIGRSPSFSLLARRLHPRYDNVSNRHAELRLEDGRIVVVDLGSSNGTFVNDRRIAEHVLVDVHLGDRLRFAADLIATIEAGDG